MRIPTNGPASRTDHATGFVSHCLVVRSSGSAVRVAALAQEVDSELAAIGIVDDPL
jgi:hypothetical protein